MKFREDKTFHILHFADIQETPDISGDTRSLMCAALDRAKPDLAVLSGDQLKGYSRKFTGDPEQIRKTLEMILEPFTSRGIPFAVTFGNHDEKCGLSNEEQMEIYRSIPGCVDWLNPRGNEIYHGPTEGTFALGIKNADETRTVLAIYMINTGGELPRGGHPVLPPNQLFWYKGARDTFKQENGGWVPGIVFRHVPLPEYYQLLKKVERGTKGAVRAYRMHANEYYVLNHEKCRSGELQEAVSIPDGMSREFESFREKGDIFAVYCGHDHKNSFVGNCSGIDLGYTPTCGFHDYGPGTQRGVREFIFHEEDPAAYETRLYTYGELVGKHSTVFLRDLLYAGF